MGLLYKLNTVRKLQMFFFSKFEDDNLNFQNILKNDFTNLQIINSNILSILGCTKMTKLYKILEI
jgi:hypothetical protein